MNTIINVFLGFGRGYCLHHKGEDTIRRENLNFHNDEPCGSVIAGCIEVVSPTPCVAGGITFLGMMVGGVVWGNLSDRMGRRRTLMSALGVNAVFSVISAFMPTYGTFMTARFCSAVG